MTTKIFFLSILAFCSILGCTQTNYVHYNGEKWEELKGNGNLKVITPSVTPFKVIILKDVNIKANILASHSNYAAALSIDENLASFFKLEQKGDTLTVYKDLSGGKYNRWISSNNITLDIKAPEIASIIMNGNSNINVRGIQQKDFALKNDGNGDIVLQGEAATFRLQSASNPKINGKDFLTTLAFISSKGNAKIIVNAPTIETQLSGNNQLYNIKDVNQKVDSNFDDEDKVQLKSITIKLKNNSILPQKITLISYRPDETGNGTRGFLMLPQSIKKVKFPVGTKLYLANTDQVNTVMSGAKITDQNPFLIVKEEDDGAIFKIK